MKCHCGGEILQRRRVTLQMTVEVPLISPDHQGPINKGELEDAVNETLKGDHRVRAHEISHQVSLGMFCTKCGRAKHILGHPSPGARLEVAA